MRAAAAARTHTHTHTQRHMQQAVHLHVATEWRRPSWSFQSSDLVPVAQSHRMPLLNCRCQSFSPIAFFRLSECRLMKVGAYGTPGHNFSATRSLLPLNVSRCEPSNGSTAGRPTVGDQRFGGVVFSLLPSLMSASCLTFSASWHALLTEPTLIQRGQRLIRRNIRSCGAAC